MFKLLGPVTCFEPAMAVSESFLKVDVEHADIHAWKQAYAYFLHRYQPSVPLQEHLGVALVDDPQLEKKLIQGFLNESPLDDFDYYRDNSYFDSPLENHEKTLRELDFIEEKLQQFQTIDPQFWQVFRFYVTYIMCPYSRFSSGGTDSEVIGVIFFSTPSRFNDIDLYEILVHEFTHTVMFIDELTRPHYKNEHLMPHTQNYARAAISGKQRPLDKVLHSLVVSTEVLLHRRQVIGHDGERKIHPQTNALSKSIGDTIGSLMSLKNLDQLLNDRGLELIAMCDDVVFNSAS